MCQAKPLPRCSTHALTLVAAADRQHENKKLKVQTYKDRLDRLLAVAKNDGHTAEDLENLTSPKLSSIKRTKEKYRIAAEELNDRLRDVWEAELHVDATKKGFKELQSNPEMKLREQRLENARLLRAWHKKLRLMKSEDGTKIFSRDGDAWLRNAVIEDEYKVATKNHIELAFRYNTVNAESRKIHAAVEEARKNQNPNPAERVQINNLDKKKNELEGQRYALHFAIVLERAKRNLLATSITKEVKDEIVSNVKKRPVE